MVIYIILIALLIILVASTIGIVIIFKAGDREENSARNKLIRSNTGKLVGIKDIPTGGGLLYGEYADELTMLGGNLGNPIEQVTYIQLSDFSTGSIYQVILKDYVVIGRSSELSGERYLAIPYADISKVHCKFYLMGGYVYVQDMNSTNHTYLNGKLLLNSMPVTSGYSISFAAHTYYITLN